MCAARNLPQNAQQVMQGKWGDWTPFQYCGAEISSATLGIVGLGRIGTRFCELMSGFGCEIIYTGPSEKPNNLGAKYVRDFNEFLRRSDIVSVHCPLNDSTRHMFNERAFRAMKSSAIFINTSRGPVVDQDALYNALKTGEIASAGLDVTNPEPLPSTSKLLELDNCVVLPHIGSATVATRKKMADLAMDNLVAGVLGEPLPYPV